MESSRRVGRAAWMSARWLRALAVSASLGIGLLGLSSPALAICSVIPPEGYDQRGFLGSLTSPFLTPDLTNDVRVVGVLCEQEERSTAPGFLIDGLPVGADDLVLTIAYTPEDLVGTSPILVLAGDPTLCDGIAACTVDTTAEREMVEVPLPGGSVERRLRFRYPTDAPVFGPARLEVRLATASEPVATGLRDAGCEATAPGTAVACIGRFYVLDGSCRVGDEFVNQPFSGLVAVPRTDFVDICTGGCEEWAPAAVSSTLPVTTDRDGNVLFGLIYEQVLLRVDRGDLQIEPRPRLLRLSAGNAVENGFADAEYLGKPSSFTYEGAGLSPPFNGFVDPTAPPDTVGFWGVVDAEFGMIFLPRRSCADDPARACASDSDCSSGVACDAAEFTFAQNGDPVALPIAEALAQQGVELNSWLDGNLSDAAVALSEDELLLGDPINRDGVADDFVVELLDRTTGLFKRLAGFFTGRGLTQVRVDRGDQDFVVPSMAAEADKLAFIESEFAEGLKQPLETTTQAEALAADVNGNGRLDQNLRLYALPTDLAAPEAVSLLPAGLELGVLADLRFDGRRNIAVSDGHVVFAYSPLSQQPHTYELVNQSSDGTPGNFFAGDVDFSSDGSTIVFVSGADNLTDGVQLGPLESTTDRNTQLVALNPTGVFPEIVDGRSVFTWEAANVGPGPLPSRFFLELAQCDPAAGELDLEALLNPALSGPNMTVRDDVSCAGCSFEGEKAFMFNRGLGSGSSQTYTLTFDSPDIPASELRFAFEEKKNSDAGTIRGPGCAVPLVGGIERVYVRDVETGVTQLVSVGDSESCDDGGTGVNVPSGNPSVTLGGGLVVFDTVAPLTDDDLDDESDVFAYDAETCGVVNLSADVAGPATNPTSSDNGSIVAFEVGTTPELYVLDRASDILSVIGDGTEPNLSADGSKLVYVRDEGSVFQVRLADLVAGTDEQVSLQDDGSSFPDGAGAPSVANDARTAFEAPPADPDSEIFVRDLADAKTNTASTVGIGMDLCTASPCGAFEPSISDDGRFVAYVVRGLLPKDEIVIKDLVTGAVTPLSRMAGADDGDSFGPELGTTADFIAFSSFASQVGGVGGLASPNVFLERPLDPSLDGRALLGLIDLAACEGAAECLPILTGESVDKGAVYAGDVAVVGSPVRVVDVGSGAAGYEVTSFGRAGMDVALSGSWVCALATTDGFGSSGSFAACGARSGNALTDLTVGGAPVAATEIGICGDRAIALSSDGVLYEANLALGFEAHAVQLAEDFELGDDLDVDGDGAADTCLVAFRSQESLLGGTADSVGNRDLDAGDLAMYVLGVDASVTDCGSSVTDCPGQACRLLNYQVGEESVLFIVDESDENFGFTPEQDPCSPGTDINLDGLCDLTVRRCTAAGSLSEGTSFGQSVNLFSEQSFQDDGENTVIVIGFCGVSAETVRIGQLCEDDGDCLQETGESCHLGPVSLSALPESDGDEIPDIYDNCPTIPNPAQADADDDGFGDACDTFTCGDGVLQEAESCDAGDANGTPGGSCSTRCSCEVHFEVTETLKPGSGGNTPITLFGSVAEDGSGCLNLSRSSVGGHPAMSIDPMSLRLSASPGAGQCSSDGGAPIHNLARKQAYRSHLQDDNGDGIEDLHLHMQTAPIGGDTSTEVLYLSGRWNDGAAPAGEACFEAVAAVRVAGH